jgi:CSLREA domain-containing protein
MRTRVLAGAGASLALALVLGFIAGPSPALASGPIRVTTDADSLAIDGACSLREAIRAANLDTRVDACRAGRGADTIRLAAGTYTLALVGLDEDAALQGDLDITADLVIKGAGRDRTIVDAASLDRVFDIYAPARVSMTGLTITHGYLDWGAPARLGAGISNGGTLHLDAVKIADNAAFDGGGGIHSTGRLVMTGSIVSGNGARDGSGGIQATGDTRLDRVEILGNGSSSLAGAPWREDPGDAGGLDVTGYLLLTRSLVSGNSGGGEWAGGGVAMAHGMVIDTTISGNSSTVCGPGGIAMVDAVLMSSTVSGNTAAGNCSWAAGIMAFDSTILNSTVSGNSIWTSSLPAAGGILASGTMIVGSTISANTFWTNREEQDSAAGLLAASGESTTLAGTILAGNLSDTGPGDCGGAVASGGWNLVGDPAGCDFVATAADLVGVDPRLGPLADNGGPTLTHALLPGSPAIDAFACRWGARRLTVLPVDQRGVRRPQDGDGDGRSRCDIGSVEMRGR